MSLKISLLNASIGSTGPTAKWFVFTWTEIRKWSCDVFNQFLRKQYFQCAKLIKEALDSRYEAAYLARIWQNYQQIMNFEALFHPPFNSQYGIAVYTCWLIINPQNASPFVQIWNNVACRRGGGIWFWHQLRGEFLREWIYLLFNLKAI